MRYELTKDLETGNALIDKEHRELLKAVNDLLDACSKGEGRTKNRIFSFQLRKNTLFSRGTASAKERLSGIHSP